MMHYACAVITTILRLVPLELEIEVLSRHVDLFYMYSGHIDFVFMRADGNGAMH